jgi:hypothetical protein
MPSRLALDQENQQSGLKIVLHWHTTSGACNHVPGGYCASAASFSPGCQSRRRGVTGLEQPTATSAANTACELSLTQNLAFP